MSQTEEGTEPFLFARFLFRQFVEPVGNIAQEHLVLKIELVIKIGAQTVFLRQSILRHHDDRSL